MNVFELPPELLLQCLAYLSPVDLASISIACRALHRAAETESLWLHHISSHLDAVPESPSPYKTFKALYATHHPYWFIPWRRLWLSDNEWTGGLVYARYNARLGSIEAFRVVAERYGHSFQPWSADPDVMIQEFNPVVKLHLDAPVIKIERDSIRQERTKSVPMLGSFFSPSSSSGTPRIAQEVLMDCFHRGLPGHKTSLSLTRDLPSSYISSSVRAWPPLNIPAPARTRNLSASDFTSKSHRPSTFEEASQSSFRIRRWLDFRNKLTGMAMGWNDMDVRLSNIYNGRGEAVETFGTIEPKAYTPTEKKPYRGIFCGDYSGHGPEFIAIMQPGNDDEAYEPPAGLGWLREWFESPQPVDDAHPPGSLPPTIAARLGEIIRAMNVRHHGEANLPPLDWDGPALDQDGPLAGAASGQRGAGDGIIERSGDEAQLHSGPLVAVKLTGDPHVPRGEITFISPDISDNALVRVSREEGFEGARIVRSAGHIANRGFVRDYYVPSQLILVSHDCLAQYWQCFNQISFYRRVDLDALAAQ